MVKKWQSILSLLLIVMLLSACTEKNNDIKQPSNDQEETNQTETVNPPVEESEETIVEPKPITPEDFILHFLQNDYTYLYEHTTQEFKDSITLEDLEDLGVPFNREVAAYNLEAKLPINGMMKYIWLDSERKKAVTLMLDEQQIISGLWINPVTTFPETDSIYSKTEFSYPFKGDWFVFWGGTNEIVNYHYAIEEQRYAYDFLIMKDGMTYKNDDKSINENYYAYGQEVFAPADGTVVELENEVEENQPGSMNPFKAAGNYVVLDHGNGEYSLLAHFKQGSITVAVGDVVKRGDLLGYVGNSGNSSEPHLHFQVMDSPDIDKAHSINIRFIDGKTPVQGDTITNP